MSEFDPLYEYLLEIKNNDEVTLTFKQIEEIIGRELPKKAYFEMQRWENSQSHTQSKAWLNAGWLVQHPREVIKSGKVTFIRQQLTPELKKDIKKPEPPTEISIPCGSLIYMIFIPIIPLGYYIYHSASGTKNNISKYYLRLFFISLGVNALIFILIKIF